MAYTIISQNNTTTTLSDENGNVITVPARVTLATSTDYTIIKVNNNSVDLEDGNGKIIRGVPACVVLAGEGGGDQHNLGYYATQAALEEAYPTAEAGDWAIVGATDTVWIWDEDTSAWVDSDQKGQVTSVNGQTGDVSLSIPDAVQYSAMPTASADNLGDIVQFTGTTDANYTNGYFYKCVSDGQDPATYSWTRVDVQPSASGYLPLTGGTLTGDLTMQNSKVQLYNSTILGSFWLESADSGYLRIGKSATASNDDLFVNTGTVNQRSIAFGNSNGGRLGSANAKLEYVYTQKISNGSDIAVPNVAGKMAVQVSSMPTASSTLEGQIYQYIGATDSTYTHGYIYECKAQGTTPDETYAWEAVEVQAGGGGGSYTAGNGIDITSDVISTTVPMLIETAETDIPVFGPTVSESVAFGKHITVRNTFGGALDNSFAAGINVSIYGSQGTAVGNESYLNAGNSSVFGYNTRASGDGVAVGCNIGAGAGGVVLGYGGPSRYTGAASTFVVCLTTSNYTRTFQYNLLGIDGKIPVERINNSAVIKYSSMPAGSPDISGMIAQYVGVTDANYTNGYFYKCVSTITTPSSAAVNTVQTTVDPSLLTIDVTTLETKLASRGITIDTMSLIYFYCLDGTRWTVNVDGVTLGSPYPTDLTQYGVTYTGTPASGDMIFVDYTPAVKAYSWLQTNVQPSGLPSTANLADGNYRLRLVMASGVPTLEWVAE